MKNQPYIVNITFDSNSDAIKICKQLLELRLIACGQISSSINSIYWWQGNMVENNEYLLQVKTLEKRLVELELKIKQLHPYDVPEIIGTKIEFISDEYLNWMKKEIN